MRLVSEYTKVVATSFGGSDEIVCRLTATLAGERKTPLRLSPAAFGDAGRRAVKLIYVYRLCRDAQRRLAQDSAPRWIPWQEA